MSNYDFNDRWTPYDEERYSPKKKVKSCEKKGEHTTHTWAAGEYDRAWSTHKGPYYNCPGVEPLTEKIKGLTVYFHDDGTVTWQGLNRD